MVQRILIVEDDPLMRNIMQKVLATTGYDVIVAADGYEAINKIKEQTFDLIVSDVRMPGIDGIETTAQVKQIQPQIKSVIVTGFADEHAPVRAVNLGIDAYLYKPFEMKDFLDIIKKKLGEPLKKTPSVLTQPAFEGSKDTNDMIEMVKTLVTALGEDKALEIIRKTAENQNSSKILELFKELYPNAEKKTDFFLKKCRDILRLGSAYLEIGQIDVAHQAYLEALAIAEGEDCLELKTEIFLGLAIANRNKKEDASRYISQAEKLVPSGGNYWAGQLALVKGRILEVWGKYIEAKEQFIKARDIFRQSEDLYYLAQALLFLTAVEITLQKEEEFREHLNQLLELAKNYSLFNLFIQESEKTIPVFVKALKEKLHVDIVMAVFKRLGSATSEAMTPLMKDEDPGVRRVARELHEFVVNEKNVYFQVHCFGRLRLKCGGRWLSQEELSKEEQAVFAYLLLNDQVGEADLGGHFWPALSHDQQNGMIQQTIARIRKLLEPYIANDAQSTYILGKTGLYSFNRERSIICDLTTFQEQLNTALELEQSGGDALNFFIGAERIYGGSFLEGHDFPWVLEYRDRYRKLYWQVLLKIVNYYDKKQDYLKALPYARKMVIDCPENEESHKIFIRTLWALDRFEEAVKQISICRMVISQISENFNVLAASVEKKEKFSENAVVAHSN